MPYELKSLSCDPAKLSGLSEKLIVSHWENNYGGAVKRLNAIEQKLAELNWASAPVFEINGLKREEMIASGSMILHEVYFDSLGGAGGDPAGALKAAIERDFGSLDAWRAEFSAMGKAQGGGSGCTMSASTVSPLTAIPLPGQLAPGLHAWATTIHTDPTGAPTVTETPFAAGTLSVVGAGGQDVGELTRLTQLCTFINATGSGFGICRSCRLGGLGAGRL